MKHCRQHHAFNDLQISVSSIGVGDGPMGNRVFAGIVCGQREFQFAAAATASVGVTISS
jgi:hypothetical protein